jgi:hypothetical protein
MFFDIKHPEQFEPQLLEFLIEYLYHRLFDQIVVELPDQKLE